MKSFNYGNQIPVGPLRITQTERTKNEDVRRTENFPSWVIKASLRVGDLSHQDLLALVDGGSEYNSLNAKRVPEKYWEQVDVCATNVDGSAISSKWVERSASLALGAIKSPRTSKCYLGSSTKFS